MRCPFLRESTASFCDVQPTCMLPHQNDDLLKDCACRGGDAASCPFVHSDAIESLSYDERGRCTKLHQRRVLACDAAPRCNWVPYVQGLLSRCQSDAYRYCPVYLGRETPAARLRGRSVEVDDVVVATDRSYSPNHLWIDEGELGTCTIGVDDLVRFLLPRLDAVHFVSHAGIERPHVVLTSGAAHLDLELPMRMEILSTNVHARREPEVVIRDPYGAGWLIEARGLRAHHRDEARAELVPADRAPAWMARERRRLDEFARAHVRVHAPELGPTATDGGRCAPGLCGRLDPLGQARLHHQFLRWDDEEEDA
jgi:glycine cleavage system H lipoate-binding protein